MGVFATFAGRRGGTLSNSRASRCKQPLVRLLFTKWNTLAARNSEVPDTICNILKYTEPVTYSMFDLHIKSLMMQTDTGKIIINDIMYDSSTQLGRARSILEDFSLYWHNLMWNDSSASHQDCDIYAAHWNVVSSLTTVFTCNWIISWLAFSSAQIYRLA